MVRAVVVLLVGALAGGCAPAGRREPPPNVVLVVLDALRPDRLGCYGNRRGLTPFLDEWASHSHVFHRAYTAVTYTIGSVASVFTSRLMSEHGVEWFNSVLPGEALTLTEVLHEQGYATGAFTASPFFKGFEQGFDVARVVDSNERRPPHADELGAAAREFLVGRDRQRPVFLYLHLVESHVPYELPPPERRPKYRRPQAPDPDRAMGLYLAGAEKRLAPDELAEIEDAYDGAVVVMDERLRALIATLRELGVMDRAIVVFIADHGDDFGEHGYVGHGRSLYETSTRVPLLVRLPEQADRVDVEQVVSLIDLAPTILDLLHVAAPTSFTGRPLLATAPRAGATGAGWREQEGEAYSQLSFPSLLPLPPWHTTAIVDGPHKLLVAADGARAYYDLAADPGETAADALQPPERVQLDRLLAAVPGRDAAHRAEKTNLGEAEKERLRALGYVAD